MISEHEQREEPAPDESEVETPHSVSMTAFVKDVPTPSTPAQPVVASVEEIYKPVALTESVLKAHNKMTEQSYIKKMIIENRLVSPSSGGDSGKDSSGESSKKRICKKRKTHGSEAGFKPYKHFCSGGNSPGQNQQGDVQSEALPLNPPFTVTADASLHNPVTTNIGLPFTMSIPIVSSSTVLQSGEMQQVGPYTVAMQELPQQHQQLYTYTYPVGMAAANAVPVMAGQAGRAIPQMARMPVTLAPTTIPTQALQGIRWPLYHPQTGIPMMQSFIYQPVANPIVQPSVKRSHKYDPSTTGSSDSSYLMPNREMETSSQPAEIRESDNINNYNECKNEESGSMEETSSSLLYLLESSVVNSTSDDVQDSDGPSSSVPAAKPRLSDTAPWLQDCQWNNAVKMEYTMPKRKAKAVLTENKVVLRRMKQSIDVVEQLQELQQYMDETSLNESFYDDEEADLLFWIEESRPVEKSATSEEPAEDKSEDMCSAGASADMADACSELASGGITKVKVTVSQEDEFADMKSESETSSAMDKSDIQGGADNALCATDKKMVDDQKNKSDEKMETGSIGSMDRCSKSSSCITPSDERSNEEAGSSLKESDNASSESGSLNVCLKENPFSSGDSDDSDTDPKDKKKKLRQLFVPLNISYEQEDSHALRQRRLSAPLLPQWLMDIDFNERVQMQYVSPPHGRKNVLEEDKKRIESMRQPQMVKEQMTELFAALGKQVGEALDVGALDVQYHGSSSDVTMDEDEPNAQGTSRAGSPRQPAVDQSQPGTSSSTETECIMHKGKGGPVKSSSRKTAKSGCDADETAKHMDVESDKAINSSDSDSGAKMQDESSEEKPSSHISTTDNPTTSENSPAPSTSEGIATMSPNRSGTDAVESSLDAWSKTALASTPSVNLNTPDVKKDDDGNDDMSVAPDVLINNTTQSELLGSLFTDDDQSNI